VFWLIALLVVILLVFVYYKRPIYEAMGVAYLFTIVETGRYDLFWSGLITPSSSSLFFIIAGFLAFAHILAKTGVVEKLISIILSVVGGLPGGAGYVALFGSSAMATMTGTAAGNVAAVGSMTIPTMIRSGFPRHLAATVEMASGAMGNQVGPGFNLMCFAILNTIYPGRYGLSTFWLGLYSVFFWMILQRWVTMLVLCKYYKVGSVPRRDRPRLWDTLRRGWSTLLIPLFILGPLLFDASCKDFLVSRYGPAGARAFSSSILMMAAGVCTIYALLIGRHEIPGGPNFKSVFNLFRDSITRVVPISVTIYFGYAIAVVFQGVEMNEAMRAWFLSFGFGPVGWALLVVIVTAFLGMVLPGSSQVAILGPAIISTGAAVGINPFLVATVMPAFTGCMESIVPPHALAMWAAIGIARSKFWETCRLTFLWVGVHAALTVIILLGLLPVYVR
jgi:TRAP-type C4-dicarboxylate transport system permease large subunit